MLRVSCRSFGTARTAITGMLGVSSFRRASVIVPFWISQRAPGNPIEGLLPHTHTGAVLVVSEIN